MDAYSHRLANQVLGNDPMAAALEITLLGPELVADGDVTCAVAGAEIEVTVDGTPAPRHEPFRVPLGLAPAVRRARQGHAADAGRPRRVRPAGDARQPRDASRQPHGTLRRPRAARGRRAAGRRAAAIGDVRRRRPLPLELPDGGARLRVVPAVHRERFTDDAWGLLVRARFTVSPQSNRMGYRLDGPALGARRRGRHPVGGDAASARSRCRRPGQPILLMAERADDRRLCDDRQRDHRGSADCRPARARRLDRVRRP